MKKLLAATLFIISTLQACKEAPGKHLPQKKMEDVLLDLAMAEAYSGVTRDNLHPSGAKNIDSLAYYYRQILDHHKVSVEEFRQSIDWYKAHPDVLDTMCNNMMNKGGRIQTEAAKTSKF